MPQRIQRRRTKGWRMPEGAISIARPSRYGNPFRVIESTVVGPPWFDAKEWDGGITGPDTVQMYVSCSRRGDAIQHAVDLFDRLLTVRNRDWESARFTKWISGARGRDLACFCPLGQPCHGDPLLRWTNA